MKDSQEAVYSVYGYTSTRVVAHNKQPSLVDFLWLVHIMMLKRYKWTIEGFTVLEVLMVLLIVGVLAAIAIPRIVSSSDAAKKISAKTIST